MLCRDHARPVVRQRKSLQLGHNSDSQFLAAPSISDDLVAVWIWIFAAAAAPTLVSSAIYPAKLPPHERPSQQRPRRQQHWRLPRERALLFLLLSTSKLYKRLLTVKGEMSAAVRGAAVWRGGSDYSTTNVCVLSSLALRAAVVPRA